MPRHARQGLLKFVIRGRSVGEEPLVNVAFREYDAVNLVFVVSPRARARYPVIDAAVADLGCREFIGVSWPGSCGGSAPRHRASGAPRFALPSPETRGFSPPAPGNGRRVDVGKLRKKCLDGEHKLPVKKGSIVRSAPGKYDCPYGGCTNYRDLTVLTGDISPQR